ncbi:MAG: alpha/beta hydrolase [Actinomycetota bacterium]
MHPRPADSADDADARHEMIPLDSGVELHVVHRTPEVVEHPPWLLVHGLASNARLWDGVAIELCRLGHPVAAVDQRGHGQSSKPDSGYDMVTVADDLDLLIDALGWDRPGVAGQSWGGNVVLEFGHRHPERASVIAVVDGGFIDLQRKFPEWDDAARALAPPPLAGTPLAQIETWLVNSMGDWPETGRSGTMANFEVRADGTIAPWLTAERHLKVLHGLWEHSPSSRFGTMAAPVLLIGADNGDVAWSDSKHRAVDDALAALPSGRAEWFAAHHDVHAQHPVAVADLLHGAQTDTQFFTPTPQVPQEDDQ